MAGGKSKKDKDSNNEDEIAFAATKTKKGGKNPNGGGKPKKENPNKDEICDHCNKNGAYQEQLLGEVPWEEAEVCKELRKQASKQEFHPNSCNWG